METANNMPEIILLIEDGPLRIPHSPSHVCVSWDSEKAQERIATCLDDYRYHGNDCLKLPLVEVSSFSKLHVWWIPHKQSAPRTWRRKPRRMFPPSSFFRSTVPKAQEVWVGARQRNRLKIAETLKEHLLAFSDGVFFHPETLPGCHGGAVSKRWTGWSSTWRVPLAAFPTEKCFAMQHPCIPGCQVQPTVGEGPGNDPKISPEK